MMPLILPPATATPLPPGRVAYRIEPGRKALFVPLPLTPEAARTFCGAEYRLAAGEAASLAREITALSGPAALAQREASLQKQRPDRRLVHTSEHRLAISLIIELAAYDAPARVAAFAGRHGYSADGLSALLRCETSAPA